jgi:hypothetical protein
MREHFRTFDSKISFFAFADIITAVSGMLVFITLLLATDLGRPVTGLSKKASTETQQQLQQTLDEEAGMDAQVARLQELLTAAETAPSMEQLQSDIAKLRTQLAEEKEKKAVLDDQMAGSQAAIAARDRALGLTDLKTSADTALREVDAIDDKQSQARVVMNGLQEQIARVQTRLLELRQMEGQLWLIPDRRLTSKEPILVTVSGTGIIIDRFNHPEQRQEANADRANPVFTDYLESSKSTNQYVVFLLKPSGVSIFDGLVQTARNKGFNVGYDALEENRQVHFSTPPALNVSVPGTGEPAPVAKESAAPVNNAGNTGAETSNSSGSAAASKPTASQKPEHPAAPPPKPKSWWDRFLDWLGVE